MTRELSPLERSLWMAYLLAPGDSSLHLQRVVRVECQVPFAEVRRRLTDRAAEIGLLQASIHVVEGRTPILVNGHSCASGWITKADCDVDIEEQIQAFVREPFDLATPPLLRVLWLADQSGATMLAFAAHHVLFDGQSFDHVVQVLLASLLGEEQHPVWLALDPGAVPWSDADAGWTDRLASLPEHDIGVDLLPPSGKGATSRLTLPPDLSQALGDVQARTGASRATILLCLFAAAVHRVLDLSDVVVVVQVDTRPPTGLNSLGMLVNTLPTRSRLGAEVTWQDFLTASQAELLHAIRHRYEPLEEIIRTVRPPRRADGSSIFSDFEFSYLRRSRSEPALAGFCDLPRPDPACRFGVSMNVVDFGDTVEVRWGTRLAGSALHDYLQAAVESLLDNLVREGDGPATADIVPRAELGELLALGTGAKRTVPLVSPTALFRQVSAEDPGRPAVLDGARSLTYGQLDAKAAAITGLLELHTVSRGDRVLLACGRGQDHIAAMVALLHLGAVYVPCDVSNPPARARVIAADALPAVAIVDDSTPTALREALREVVGTVVELQEAESLGAGLPEPTAVLRSDDPVYLLFTSGSTGRPKGVEVGLRAFLNHLDMLRAHLELVPGERVGQTAPLGFDIHVWQALAPLLGATAVVFDAELRDPERLMAEVDRLDVGILELVPSYLRLLCDLLESRPEGPMRMSRVRHVLTTGEAIDASLLPRIRAAFPHATITNAYGPAEAADDVALHVLRESEYGSEYGSIPIGFPAQNVELLVVDRWRRVRPIGLPGELLIGGPVLANGYVDRGSLVPFGGHPYRPGERGYLTGDIVVMTREHGLLFRGRSDDQVKLGGRRVELGEIERAVRSVAGVKDAAVAVFAEGKKSTARLNGFVVMDASVTAEDVRTRLSGILPDFMVPSRILALAEIPRSANGKLDRAALRALLPAEGMRNNTVGGSLADLVHSAWTEVLGAGAADRNFFDAGGDSLRAIDLVARLSAGGIAVGVRDLYQNQTLEEFTGVVLRRAPLPDLRLTGVSFDPTPRQRQMIAAMEAGARPPVLALMLDEAPDTRIVVSSLVALVRSTDALRLSVRLVDGDGAPRLVVRPFSAEVTPTVVQVEPGDHDSGVSDADLVKSAARTLDPLVGRMVGVSYSGSRICITLSHLVSDVATLVEVTAALAEGIRGRQGTLRSGMAAWSQEMSHRGDQALQAHGGYIERVAEVTRLQLPPAKPALCSENSELVTRVIPVPGLGGAEPGRIPGLVLAMVARAMFIQSGLERLRLDVEVDGRDSFSAFGVPGDGVGCFTLLRPVVVSAADLSPAGVLDAVERAMAVQPPAWTWDAALMTGRLRATGPLPAVPLVNLIGRSISLPWHAGLAEQVVVPLAVTAWNLPSEEHGLVIDVVKVSPTGADTRQETRWEAQVTARSGYWPWGVDAFLAHFVRSAAEFAPAFASSAAPLPKGLDLLGIAEEEIADLLRELGGGR